MSTEIVPADVALPALRHAARFAERLPERSLYVARAGVGALPSGLGTMLLFMLPQAFALAVLLWAIWWPEPTTRSGITFAWGCTGLLFGLLGLVLWMLVRRNPGFVLAVLRAPFTRITVTDRRVIWSVPWTARPLMEVGRNRILGAMLGPLDKRGRGSAAMMLVDGDPAADVDGNIHFDRLPHAARFVAALGE